MRYDHDDGGNLFWIFVLVLALMALFWVTPSQEAEEVAQSMGER